MDNNLWLDDSIQFPRLIAEISACVNILEDDWEALMHSMDLTNDELNSLFDRAIARWESIKAQAKL